MIAGLGNPGRRYSRTRHNIGFCVLDLFASRQKCPWEERERFATIGSHVLDDTEILLVKPQTYMNRSGEVVGRILDESGVPTESVIVVHDDMDLPFETMKLKKGGGAGGHRGIESILWELGSDRFLRVKMGIGRPETGEQPEDYVLGAFPDEQAERLPAVSHARSRGPGVYPGARHRSGHEPFQYPDSGRRGRGGARDNG